MEKDTSRDWVQEAKQLFAMERPAHFTDHTHCEECADHDATLCQAAIDTIGLDELGNPGWDPVCFCTNAGKRYYMPAFVRLSLETVASEFYFSQFLFHLAGDGPDNSLLASCTEDQRRFIASFVAHMIDTYPEEIENDLCTDEALAVYRIWSGDRTRR